MLNQRRLAMEILALFCIAAAVHLAVLRWLYPGFLDPLWPNHDDLYLPMYYASRSRTLIDYLRDRPRSVGFFFFGSSGYLGLHGALAAVICLVMLNCALAAAFFRRIAGIAFGWLFLVGFSVYAFLLFSEPHFYIVYRNDIFMHCSFFFMISGAWIFWRIDAKHPYAAIAIPFIASLAAFQCKETYGVTALALGLVWLLLEIRKRGFWLAAAPGAATALGLALSLLADRLKDSPFTAQSGPYQTDLHPLSILRELLRYAEGAVNPLTVAVVAVAGWLAFRSLDRRSLWLAVPICAALAVLAWVPNALMPGHHYSGYSWSGACILFLPVLLIAGTSHRKREAGIVVAGILVAAALSPLLFREEYRIPENLWSLAQEANQRNQIEALEDLAAKAPEGGVVQHILVTGITSPFTVFHLPPALRWMYPKFDNAKFDLVYYVKPTRQPSDGIDFIPSGSAQPAQYAAVWAFNRDGTLRSAGPAPTDLADPYVADIGLPARDLVIYPELLDVFPNRVPGHGGAQASATQYFQCGTLLLDYRDFAMAETCLSRAIELQPNDPYAFYFRGMAQESLGKLDLARASYAEAVEKDRGEVRNSYFQAALAHLAAEMAPKP
jgi:hypothetical protein